MRKTSRPAALLAFALTALMLLGAVAPAAAFGARERAVLKALDFMHARQQSTGGFIDIGASDSPSTTPWAILAITGARESALAWNSSGKDPIDYLQALNLESAARSSMNPPAFYAKTILAYTAAVRNPLIIQNAGTPKVNLLEKLNTYRSTVDGHYSPDAAGDRALYDVSTTTWSLLALVAAGQSLDGSLIPQTRAWLTAAQNEDGGWGIQSGAKSSVDQTAAAIQALVAAGVSQSSTTVQQGIGLLRAAQRADGGFGEYLASTKSNAESTAWTVQAIVAAGQDPTADPWVKGGNDPLEYIRGLRQPNGSFAHAQGTTGKSTMMTTTQCVLALSRAPLPLEPPANPLTSGYMPSITSFKPGNGAVFSSTNDVSVTAEYVDNRLGTGIKTSAVRVKVDGVDKTSKAKVYSSKLSLLLVDLSYGQHSIEVRVSDRAGNIRVRTHTITVSYTTGGGSSGGGSGGVYYPPSDSGSGRTPTPTTTLYPTPAATPTPTPTPTDDGTVSGTPLTPGPSGSPVPSSSPSAAAAASEDGGGSGSGLGGILLAMLPIGAALSYWLHRRQVAALSNAGRGKILAGGGTPWQRLKGRLPGTS